VCLGSKSELGKLPWQKIAKLVIFAQFVQAARSCVSPLPIFLSRAFERRMIVPRGRMVVHFLQHWETFLFFLK